jgi:hypothetical protein
VEWWTPWRILRRCWSIGTRHARSVAPVGNVNNSYLKVGLLSYIDIFAKFLGDVFRILRQKVEPKCFTTISTKKLHRRQTNVGKPVDLASTAVTVTIYRVDHKFRGITELPHKLSIIFSSNF